MAHLQAGKHGGTTHVTGQNQARSQHKTDTKQLGMAAELADILDQLDDASRLADEIGSTQFMQ